MAEGKIELLKGTLELLVLQILSSMGPTHGYGIARRLEQISGDELAMNEGTIYAALVRLQQRGPVPFGKPEEVSRPGHACHHRVDGIGLVGGRRGGAGQIVDLVERFIDVDFVADVLFHHCEIGVVLQTDEIGRGAGEIAVEADHPVAGA